jgi:hypothetical protein
VLVEVAAGLVVEVEAGDEGDADTFAVAMACSNAAIVAASTVPVGLTPSSVWKDIRASVKAGVHFPSTGPVQNRASVSVCCTAAVEAKAS